MLQARNLSKSFGRLPALVGLNATLCPGQVVALIGPNGAGKTTFLKCALGLVRPDAGTLCLDGVSLLDTPDARRRIGYMPQIGRFPEHLRVAQILELMRELRRGTHERVDEDLLHALQISRFAHQPARTLSGGMRQKLSACLAFLFAPDVVVLDEPTAGLDPVAVEILKEKVRAERTKGRLFLVTSHILSDLDEIATDLLYLIEGRLQLQRPIAELKAESGETRLERVIARLARAAADGGKEPAR